MKKILLLGGSKNIKSVIDEIHNLGYYAITCGSFPEDVGHKFSDEYHNVNILDKEAVLQLAQRINIDGIMAFACDAGVLSAAYVAEKLNLPFQCSYEVACILQNKGKFRKFLLDNGFNCPHAKSYSSANIPVEDLDYFNWPVIVKPDDAAGSRGVSRVDKKEDLTNAVQFAAKFSKSKSFVIEDYITFKGYHSSGDWFCVDGKLKYCSFSDHAFDENAANIFCPTVNIMPSTMSDKNRLYLKNEIQRLFDLLELRTGIYNIETCVGSDDKPYIMEISPRGAANRITDLQKLATGVDLVRAEIKGSVGEPVGEIPEPEFDAVWCTHALHLAGNDEGIFKELKIDPTICKNNLKFIDLAVEVGDVVKPLTSPGNAIGDIILRFDSREELDEKMSKTSQWLNIVVE